VVFLEKLESYTALPSELTLHLGALYNLSTTPNAEIRLRFYQVALSDPSSSAAKSLAVDAAKWVIGDDGSGVVKGRMKFCRPILRAVTKVDRDLAIKNWEKAKMGFHPIARKLIEKVKMAENIHYFVALNYLLFVGYGNRID
jgi:leukotriene-A4 hydrolase